MAQFFQYLTDMIFSGKQDLWTWFSGLTREEWLVVLVLVTVFGFLCMLGYGSRSKF